MILELHILQNFAPSNLNRDDTNAPKECEFGGVRRARISSQCIKRSVRNEGAFADAVKAAGGDLGIRTRLLVDELVRAFKEEGKGEEKAAEVAADIVDILGLKLKKESEKTEYLLYLGRNEIGRLVKEAISRWDDFSKDDKDIQKNIKMIVSNKVKNNAYAADIALFGRMAAGAEDINVDASCQVAHAISVNKVDMEMDYFTAVDDLLPGDEVGAGMIGTVEFNSSCFYRYSVVDLRKLFENLGHNKDLLSASVCGFAEASVLAIPTGKQNSMAAQNPPSVVSAVLKSDSRAISFANAFARPVKPSREKSLAQEAGEALINYSVKMKDMYGSDNIKFDKIMNEFDDKPVSLSELLSELKEKIEREF